MMRAKPEMPKHSLAAVPIKTFQNGSEAQKPFWCYSVLLEAKEKGPDSGERNPGPLETLP